MTVTEFTYLILSGRDLTTFFFAFFSVLASTEIQKMCQIFKTVIDHILKYFRGQE